MTITTNVPQGLLIDSLSRAIVLLREHGAELPPYGVRVSTNGPVLYVVIQDEAGDGATRYAAVAQLARILRMDPPTELHGQYIARNPLWHVYTSAPVRCGSCRREAVR